MTAAQRARAEKDCTCGDGRRPCAMLPSHCDRCGGTIREEHRCTVETTTADPFYPGHPGYVADCETCGPVGQPQDRPGDAQAIANRHEEIGGFER